jgi:hypothetical protein
MLLYHGIAAIGRDETREVIKRLPCSRLGRLKQTQLSLPVSTALGENSIRPRDLSADVLGTEDLSGDALQDGLLQEPARN